MNINNDLLKDKIVPMVLFYVIFVIASFVLIFGVDNYMHKRIRYINSLYFNESAKIQLNDILKNKIAHIENIILSYTGASQFKELDIYEKDITETIDSIASLLYVLEHGGTYAEKFNVNYQGLEDAEISISYVNNSQSRYNIQVMDMRAKLVDVKNIIDLFRNITIDLIIASSSDNLQMINESTEKKYIAVKSLEAFFERMDESSNRLFVEADESEKLIKSYLDETALQFRKAKLKINLLLGIVIIFAGIFITMRIIKAVRERREYSLQISELNSKLEEKVKKRTEQLEIEVRIREQKELESVSKAQFLMAVIESLAHPFYVIDVDTYEIVLANNAAYEVIGGKGNTCHELTHHSNFPCDGIDHPCPLKSVLETGQPTSVEHIHTVKGGEKRYVEVHGYPVKDETGKIIQMIEYSLDVTDKKEAEVALINLNSMLEQKVAERTQKLENEIKNRELAEQKVKARELHFRQLIANISDLIIIVDKSFRIKYMSPSVQQVCGFSTDQLMGKSMEDLVHDRDKKVFRVWSESTLKNAGEKRVIEFRMQKKTGQFMNAEALGKNLLDDDLIAGVVINVRDVSLRKKAEEDIRKLALVMDQNPNSILITDVEANIEYVNPAFEEITGYKLAEVIGKNPNFLKTDDTSPEVFTKMWDTVTRGEVWNGEFVNKKKNGEHYTEHAIIAPIMNDRGEIISYLGMKENVTELKKAREKAEESNKAKSMFLANMSHEIRTPLNGLIGFLELLRDTKLDSEQKDYVKTIKFSADALLKVLNDILDLSKIESGMMEMESTEFDLGHNVMSTAKSFYAKACNQDISLYSYIDPRLPEALIGDPYRINQVVSNLLNNALKFTDAGGTVRVSAELIREQEGSALVKISVEDDGVGIPESKLKSIFDSFAQVDSSITRKFGGTGLGLTICRNLLNMMNSNIQVESAEGEGSRFFFEISFKKITKKQRYDRSIKDVKVVYISAEDDIFNGIIERYLKSMVVDYEILRDYPVDAPAGACVILRSAYYEKEAVDSMIDSGCRIVVAEECGRADSIKEQDSRINILQRPFDASAFYEAVTGEAVSGIQHLEDIAEKQLLTGRVLLAEDNEVNVKLMETMLSRFGLDVDTAGDGYIASEKFTETSYDLVLMDINMPAMDGATSAAKIREYEKAFYKERTPIIALTAHTLQEINKRFADNDFDGFLAKPVQVKELEELLYQYMKPAIEEASPGEYDIDKGAILAELGLPEDIVKGLVMNMCSTLTDDLPVMEAHLDAGEYDKLKSLAHSYRGAAENLRLKKLSQILKNIEGESRIEHKQGIINFIDEIKKEIIKLTNTFNSVNE